ncbi:MAG TPA: hypothetical protein VKA30_00665 [Actinomycetota bacterium]|nr:hypothetical protein [Actinomycetota bacterium]
MEVNTVTTKESGGLGAAALVIVLGGAAALAGSLLSWIQVGTTAILARFTRGADLTVHGTSLLSGKLALVTGIVLVVVGAALWTVRSGDGRRWLAVLGVVGGALVAGAAIAAFQNGGLAILREAIGGALKNRAGGSLSFLRGGRLGALQGLQALAPSHGPGLYLTLTGGIVALLGSIAAVFWSTTPVGAPAVRAVAAPGPTEAFSKGRAA